MKAKSLCQFVMLLVAGLTLATVAHAECPSWLNQDFHRLRSTETVNLCEAFGDKPLLIVNTASFCGYTGQFTGLEKLYQRYHARGFEIIGVPSNDFRQEAKSEQKTAEVCFVDYKVTFTMTAPQNVRGDSATPLFRKLAELSGSQPQWNFNKYLVDQRSGQVWHFSSQVQPDDEALTRRIDSLL